MTTQPGLPVRLLSCHRSSFVSFRYVSACDESGFPSSLTYHSFHSVGVSIFLQLSFCVSSLIPPCCRPSTAHRDKCLDNHYALKVIPACRKTPKMKPNVRAQSDVTDAARFTNPNILGYWIWNVRKTSEVSLSYYSIIRQRFPHMKTLFLGMNIHLASHWTKNKWFLSVGNRLAGVIAEIPTPPFYDVSPSFLKSVGSPSSHC